MKTSEKHIHAQDGPKNDTLLRLRRIEGQIRGIFGMVEKDVYCQDILDQIASARAALFGLQQAVLKEHVEHCIAERMTSDRRGATEELLAILKKIV